MKIGPVDTQPVPPAPAERRSTAAPTPSRAEPSAKVELSSTATQLAGAASDPTFDTAKVDRIAQAIRDGKFKVNPEAIADRLIINAAELLGSRPS